MAGCHIIRPQLPSLSANALFSDPFAQHIGDDDRPVRLLIVLENRDNRAADRNGGAVERVDELSALFAFGFVANIESARLVVGAVRGAGDFAVFAAVAAAGHPGFEIEFAVRGAAEVAGSDIKNAVRYAEAVEDFALEVAEIIVHVVALIGQREGEHLDLRELVDAIEAARGAARLHPLRCGSNG